MEYTESESENQEDSASYSDSGYDSECESHVSESEVEQEQEIQYDDTPDTVQYVNGSILEEYSEEDPCLLCGKGPFCELEYHLVPFCGCGKAWYHPACTVKCLRVAFGEAYFLPMVCPYCHPKKGKK